MSDKIDYNKVRNSLVKAKEQITKRGWVARTFEDEDGRICPEKAFRLVDASDTTRRMFLIHGAGVTTERPNTLSNQIVSWNDAMKSTPKIRKITHIIGYTQPAWWKQGFFGAIGQPDEVIIGYDTKYEYKLRTEQEVLRTFDKAIVQVDEIIKRQNPLVIQDVNTVGAEVSAHQFGIKH